MSDERSSCLPSPPDATDKGPPPAGPAIRRISGSTRGGWSLFGRLLIWAMRNNGPDGDVS